MASNHDFSKDFISLDPENAEKWTSIDLHLAAELGKNLLERNKELENDIRQKQIRIDDQAKEIEHLTKQTAALRSTNDNRIRLYEQLEVSIQDLESANKRLTLDCTALRKEIKSLATYKDNLEGRCEELQIALEKAKDQQRINKIQQTAVDDRKIKNKSLIENKDEDDDEVLLARIEELQKLRTKDQRIIAELEAELARRAEEVAMLEEDIAVLKQRAQRSLTLQEELSALEQARANEVCSHCYSSLYETQTNNSFIPEEDDDLYHGAILDESKAEKGCQRLVQKYEAIMEERYLPWRMPSSVSTSNTLSLQDELKVSGEYNSPDTDIKETRRGKVTPTDFSEAETSSSGFADETTCCKQTQTEKGSFVCSFEDGEGQLVEYTTLSPIKEHFRNLPEHQMLFQEIFAILKRCEHPPMPENLKGPSAPKVPPVTPAAEALPIDYDDLISLPDSVATSDVSSINEKDVRLDGECAGAAEAAEAAVPAGGTKDFLEYLAKPKHKKKKRSSNTPPRGRAHAVMWVGGTPEPSPVSSPSRGKRTPRRRHQSPVPVESHVMTTVQRNSSGFNADWGWDAQPFESTAAQEVAKLKRLERSYAEVLAQKPYSTQHSQRKVIAPSYGKKS